MQRPPQRTNHHRLHHGRRVQTPERVMTEQQNLGGRAAREFTEKEREFVRQHHKIYTMRQIGDALEISMHQVGRLLHELNLTTGVKKNNEPRLNKLIGNI